MFTPDFSSLFLPRVLVSYKVANDATFVADEHEDVGNMSLCDVPVPFPEEECVQQDSCPTQKNLLKNLKDVIGFAL